MLSPCNSLPLPGRSPGFSVSCPKPSTTVAWCRTDGSTERDGIGDLAYGWIYALAQAVGKAIGVLDAESGAKMRN